MATRVSPAEIKEKNRRNKEKKARREGGTFTNKAGKEVGISQTHEARKNAELLGSAGSPEAQAFNANQAAASPVEILEPPTPMPAPATASAQDPNRFGANMISEANNVPNPVIAAITQFTSGFVNTPKEGDLSTAESAGSATGIITLGIGGVMSKAPKAATAVDDALRLGSTLAKTDATTSAGKIAANTKTAQQTTTWINRLAIQLGKPSRIAGLIAATTVGALGTYPFAGFIKEEALQSLEFGYTRAAENNDVIGMQDALAMRREILDVTLQEQIINAVPFVNVVKQLKDYYAAAELKLAIDQRHFDDLQIQAETGESEEEKWARINAEQDARREQIRQENEAYYAAISQAQQRAKEQNRKEDAEYYAKIFAEREAREQKLREQEAAFWNEYYASIDKRAAKSAGNSQSYDPPSKLNFGLI